MLYPMKGWVGVWVGGEGANRGGKEEGCVIPRVEIKVSFSEKSPILLSKFRTYGISGLNGFVAIT